MSNPCEVVVPMESCSIALSMIGSSNLRCVAGSLLRVMARVPGLVPARLEHREHSIGHREAAGGIAGTEQHRNEADRLFLHRARRSRA